MYDPSELIHDTRIRDWALGASHLEDKPFPPLRRAHGPRNLPLVLLTTLVGVVAGGWLF